LRRNCLLKHVIEGQIGEEHKWWEDEKEGIGNYRKTLTKLEDR
jgi:hypothetical protein